MPGKCLSGLGWGWRPLQSCGVVNPPQLAHQSARAQPDGNGLLDCSWRMLEDRFLGGRRGETHQSPSGVREAGIPPGEPPKGFPRCHWAVTGMAVWKGVWRVTLVFTCCLKEMDGGRSVLAGEGGKG